MHSNRRLILPSKIINHKFIPMKKTVFFGVLCMLLLNIHACKKTDNKEATHQYTEGNHPVKELFLSSIGGFNEGNLKLFYANFAPEIKMYADDGNYFGRSALQERFEILFKKFPDMKMEIPELKLEILSKEVVLVNFKWKLYPMGKGPAYSGVGSGVYKYLDDQWMEILEVETTTHVDEELKQQRIN